MQTKQYTLGETNVTYLIDESGRTALVLLPKKCNTKLAENWDAEHGQWNPRSEYIREWRPGTLAQLHLRHHTRSRGNGFTEKFSESTNKLVFDCQRVEQTTNGTQIITVLKTDENYKVIHTLGYENNHSALWCKTTFVNESNKVFELEMLSSFCLENLSPCQFRNDQTGKLALHRFYGGWALEGKHVCQPIEELGLQKAWCSAFPKGERFGSVGSWTTQRYFPTAAVEDLENHLLWAVSLEAGSSWQMELTRDGDTLSFSGGLADMETGAWMKRVNPGEQFTTPIARLCAVQGDIQDACQTLLEFQNIAVEAYGENDLGVVFNEYCSSWGNPTQEKELQYAEILKDKNVKYFVIDAGWSKGSHEQWGNGEWLVDTNRFPDLLLFSKKIREMGMVPGIWFEFEVTTQGSRVFEHEYDDMHLKRDGVVISFGTDRTFWDFRNPKVIDYLTEHVIDFLNRYDLGYLKVDYNGNVGIGCDGAESLGEGLRQQMEGVRSFFTKMKQQVPGLIIENCASGGHRMEPSMMSVTAMTSFSDAHEPREIPYIAACQQNLILPRQNLIWAVLRGDDTIERLQYSIAAGLLGRLCLSGDIERLTVEQWKTVTEGIAIYNDAKSVILSGTTRVYSKVSPYLRHPKGLQAVVRKNENEMFVICHGFEDASETLEIPLEETFELKASYGQQVFTIKKDRITITGMKDFTACVLYLKKK